MIDRHRGLHGPPSPQGPEHVRVCAFGHRHRAGVQACAGEQDARRELVDVRREFCDKAPEVVGAGRGGTR